MIAKLDTGAAGQGPSGASYEDLYLRRERQNWRTEELDFSSDAADWRERLSVGERSQLLWFMALFFHGEERVAVELAPFIDVAPEAEQQVCLTTQVDEARRGVFDRYYRDALGLDGATMADRLEAVRGQLSGGFHWRSACARSAFRRPSPGVARSQPRRERACRLAALTCASA